SPARSSLPAPIPPRPRTLPRPCSTWGTSPRSPPPASTSSSAPDPTCPSVARGGSGGVGQVEVAAGLGVLAGRMIAEVAPGAVAGSSVGTGEVLAGRAADVSEVEGGTEDVVGFDGARVWPRALEPTSGRRLDVADLLVGEPGGTTAQDARAFLDEVL